MRYACPNRCLSLTCVRVQNHAKAQLCGLYQGFEDDDDDDDEDDKASSVPRVCMHICTRGRWNIRVLRPLTLAGQVNQGRAHWMMMRANF